MTPLKILKLDAGHAFSQDSRSMAPLNNEHPNITNLDQYLLHQTDLSEYNVLAITDFIDQEYLLEQQHVIESFLADGKIIVACTHIFRSWLPGVNPFMPKMIYKHTDYEMKIINEESFFKGVDMQELAYRKGVSGFYARGYHPLTNPDAEVLLAFNDGTPISYIDRNTTKGTMVVHAARDLFSYATGDNSTKRISKQFMQWLQAEVDLLKGDHLK